MTNVIEKKREERIRIVGCEAFKQGSQGDLSDKVNFKISKK